MLSFLFPKIDKKSIFPNLSKTLNNKVLKITLSLRREQILRLEHSIKSIQLPKTYPFRI
jgi:hypothetical protein